MNTGFFEPYNSYFFCPNFAIFRYFSFQIPFSRGKIWPFFSPFFLGGRFPRVLFYALHNYPCWRYPSIEWHPSMDSRAFSPRSSIEGFTDYGLGNDRGANTPDQKFFGNALRWGLRGGRLRVIRNISPFSDKDFPHS